MDVLAEPQALEALRQVFRAFYEARPIHGQVQARFGVGRLTDSDLNSVFDAYLYHVDKNTGQALKHDSRHVQLLSTTLPLEVIGYDIDAIIHEPEPDGEITIEILGKKLSDPCGEPGKPFIAENMPFEE